MLVFFDDILVYSKTWDDHLLHLKAVLEVLRANTLFAKMSKCQFGVHSIEYLEHIISKEGVATDPQKVACMNEWPIRRNIRQLRGFLGLTGYYRKFIKHYGLINRPLTELLKKDNFKWGEEANKALTELKNAMVSAPVLALPDFS